MKIHLSRAVVATGLGVSLWFGSIAVVAAPQQSKDQTQTPATQSQTSQSQTAQPNQKSTTQQPQQTASNGKTLSTNEDPNMIGKRNINGGVWGKLASGTEKEVKMGRMLAAQVDKEAKFIDDPILKREGFIAAAVLPGEKLKDFESVLAEVFKDLQLEGEPEAIWAFLGSDRLAAPIIEHQPDLVLHGHAHAGAFEGRLGGVPVFNVSVPVIGRDFWVFELTGSARHPAEIH